MSSASEQPLVLVVDDTPQIRLLLRLNLELEGFDVEEACDGEDCVGRLRDETRRRPDVVTLDSVMEPVDGWTALSQIRSDPQLTAVPVVMITASVQAHHRARAQAVGVDVFVEKPFEPDAVVEAVRSLLDGRQG
ncbi:MAG TPA: response regulator [Actinomycetales bacterium]|nr:response regulator [Actinomycetales bacterium]